MKKKKVTRAIGRPSSRTPELAGLICKRLAGGESLRSICREEGMPDIVTVWKWRDNEEFDKQYARAREEQAETLADEIISIADASMPIDTNGKIDSAAVNQARLKIDARKWVASKLKPKTYGDATTLRGDSEAPLHPVVNLTLNK